MYVDEFKLLTEKQGFQHYGLVKNNFVINGINYMHKYMLHLGNCYATRSFFPYCIGAKTKEFIKFTKPFYFRSKKKKK
jgi:hypothetical protein